MDIITSTTSNQTPFMINQGDRIYSPARFPESKNSMNNRPPLIPGRVIIRTPPRFTQNNRDEDEIDVSCVYSRTLEGEYCSDDPLSIITEDSTSNESVESIITINHSLPYGCNECPICMEPLLFNNDTIIGTTVPCGHCFHWDCFQQYRNHSDSFPTCPVCQKMTSGFIRIYLSSSVAYKKRDHIPPTSQTLLIKKSTSKDEDRVGINIVESNTRQLLSNQRRENEALKEENLLLLRMLAEKDQGEEDDSLLDRFGRWIQKWIHDFFVRSQSLNFTPDEKESRANRLVAQLRDFVVQ